jgi:hypothetical protein
MKTFRFLTIFLSLLAGSAFAQTGKKTITLQADGQPMIKFEKTVHDFGTI